MSRIRIGLIGCGSIATKHVAKYLRLKDTFEIVATCDVRESSAKATAEKAQAETFYQDYHQLLARRDIEAVDIMLPHYLNEEAAIAAAKAEKHVLVEKPIARTLEAADRMIEAADSAGVTFMVAENECYDPHHEKVKELLDEGVIGNILSARADHQGFMGKDPAHWLYSAEKTGGGAVITSGIHRVHVLRWLVGEISRVCCFKANKMVPMEGEDTAFIILEFENGALGELAVIWINKAASIDSFDPWYESLYLYGEKGVIHNIGGLHVYSEKDARFASGFKKVSFGKTFRELWEESIERELQHFAHCILNHQVPLTSGEECKRSLEVVLACYESARTGKAVEL